jgi:NTE family protein
MTSNILTHLILSDGGLKGIAYIGVLQYLYIENMLKDIKHIAGTSIGAYFALVFALRIPFETIQTEFYNIIMNIEREQCAAINFENCNNLFFNKGMISVDFVLGYVTDFIEKKYQCSDMTFVDFVKRTGVNIYVSSSNIHSGKMHLFSLETTPNVSIIQAVKSSMCIPFLFEPVEIDGDLFNDGCLTSPLSLNNIFTDIDCKNKLEIYIEPTIGEANNSYSENEDIKSYFMRIFEILYKNHFNKQSMSNTNQNILYFSDIPYGEVMKFKITNEKIKIDVTKEDYDLLVLFGFSEISKFMKKNV